MTAARAFAKLLVPSLRHSWREADSLGGLWIRNSNGVDRVQLLTGD